MPRCLTADGGGGGGLLSNDDAALDSHGSRCGDAALLEQHDCLNEKMVGGMYISEAWLSLTLSRLARLDGLADDVVEKLSTLARLEALLEKLSTLGRLEALLDGDGDATDERPLVVVPSVMSRRRTAVDMHNMMRLEGTL